MSAMRPRELFTREVWVMLIVSPPPDGMTLMQIYRVEAATQQDAEDTAVCLALEWAVQEGLQTRRAWVADHASLSAYQVAQQEAMKHAQQVEAARLDAWRRKWGM